jgi:DNA-binding transcriptional ArsR family regulator
MSTNLDPAAMHHAADSACGLMKVLANPDRLMLLCQLAHAGEMSVGELEQILDIRQPTLSQQLTVLRAENLVDTRREGKYIYYRVRSGPAVAVLQAVYQAFCRPAGNRGPRARRS